MHHKLELKIRHALRNSRSKMVNNGITLKPVRRDWFSQQLDWKMHALCVLRSRHAGGCVLMALSPLKAQHRTVTWEPWILILVLARCFY